MKVHIFANDEHLGRETHMKVHSFTPGQGGSLVEPHRVEVPLNFPGSPPYKIILLDAEDSFDIIVEDTDGRECYWSLVKGPQL